MTALGCPYALALLVVPLALALYFRYTARRDSGVRKTLGMAGPGRAALWRPALLVLASALVAVSLARPLGPPAEGERTAGMDVIICLDISDSMAARDVDGGRLEAAKMFIASLVQAAPDNRYGLVLFSGAATVTCPLTIDREAFLNFLADADFPRADVPGTAIGDALSAASRFKADKAPRAVVVVTDGENTYGEDPDKAASGLMTKGVKVYTVGVGTAEGDKIPVGADFFGNVKYKTDRAGRVVVSKLDADALGRIASAGGGEYVDSSAAGSAVGLAKKLRAPETKKVKDPFMGAKEYGPWFVLGAFALAVAAVAL
ncbi:MAG: VWA domain-containing protein [Nitrospirae bacterium]|nr:VWA domain-containing protein [Nitrospirota bacterium]